MSLSVQKLWRPAAPQNYMEGRDGQRPEKVVLHYMAGTLEGTAAWFANPASGVSAHYGLNERHIQQYVKEEDTAWHVRDDRGTPWVENTRLIGIEHEGRHSSPTLWDWRPGPLMLDLSTDLCADILSRYPHMQPEDIVRHSDLQHKPQCPGPLFPLGTYQEMVREKLSARQGGDPPHPARLVVIHDAQGQPIMQLTQPSVWSYGNGKLNVRLLE